MIKSPVKWMGGKHASASRILQAFPDPRTYRVYIEPFGGAAHVLLAKPHYGHTEIYNDLDGLLVNFWKQLQRDGAALRDEILKRPHSRQLYYEYHHSLYGSVSQNLRQGSPVHLWRGGIAASFH
jgi:DNA adenine methylase